MTRTFALLCAIAVGASGLAGCQYKEEQLWEGCCILMVHTDETSSSPGRIAILELGGRGVFHEDGRRAGRSPEAARWQEEKVEGELQSFLEGNAGTQPEDYFAGMGMACRSAGSPKMFQCDADLGIWIWCDKWRFLPFGHVPVPKELRQPIPALLHIGVTLSGSKVLDIYSRVAAVPGGRLCHR
ncbi:MAG: hypothetical protein GEV13_16510 [Rhodospirillales bacterium]|nr:hypothetical protein [Rhodospirillales bacterium]